MIVYDLRNRISRDWVLGLLFDATADLGDIGRDFIFQIAVLPSAIAGNDDAFARTDVRVGYHFVMRQLRRLPKRSRIKLKFDCSMW
jgi:hypothetical protein